LTPPQEDKRGPPFDESPNDPLKDKGNSVQGRKGGGKRKEKKKKKTKSLSLSLLISPSPSSLSPKFSRYKGSLT